MKKFLCLALILSSLLPAIPSLAQESLDNLPLPRWAALASPEINIRTGPGKRYPIDWIFRKKFLPVEIIQEFEHWRRIKEPAGATGWVHKSMLTAVRQVMVMKEQPLYARNTKESRIVATLQKGVIAPLETCRPDWCQIKIDGFEGWAQKKGLWGIYKDETLK